MKKLFIKIAKILGFEIIDQNNFSSPTLNKELNEDLSIINEKSIILPLGEVKISRQVKSILIIVRMNTEKITYPKNTQYISRFAIAVREDNAPQCLSEIVKVAGQMKLTFRYETS